MAAGTIIFIYASDKLAVKKSEQSNDRAPTTPNYGYVDDDIRVQPSTHTDVYLGRKQIVIRDESGLLNPTNKAKIIKALDFLNANMNSAPEILYIKNNPSAITIVVDNYRGGDDCYAYDSGTIILRAGYLREGDEIDMRSWLAYIFGKMKEMATVSKAKEKLRLASGSRGTGHAYFSNYLANKKAADARQFRELNRQHSNGAKRIVYSRIINNYSQRVGRG
ncbi:MAG: hypothetical protein LBT45_00120 [Rickettsiales bacterium]|nr:hypothetical protein [Rickettsiales bacterium]